MTTVPYQTYIMTPTLQLILQNYNEIMTAYNNIILQYNNSSTIKPYYLMEFSDNAYKNETKDKTYYNEYENGTITAEVLADYYLTDLYTNIYNISSTSPLLTEITTLENYISKIQEYYTSGNIWYVLFYLNNPNQSNGNVLLAYEVNSSKQYGSTDIWSYSESKNNYQCRTITQITNPNEHSSVQVDILVMNVNDVQNLENELYNMIENLEKLVNNNSLMNIINKLNNILYSLGNEIYNELNKIIGLEVTIYHDILQQV
jgi:hypothetical protein